MKTDDIISEVIGRCTCGNDPVYEPEDELARAIIHCIPGNADLKTRQKLHGEIVKILRDSLILTDEPSEMERAAIN